MNSPNKGPVTRKMFPFDDVGCFFCRVSAIRQVHLTHWDRVTHICVGKLTTIGSDNGLSPEWRQAIIWTNTGILLIEPYGTNFSEILIAILTFSFTKMSLKVSSAKWRPFYLGLNELKFRRGPCYQNTLQFIWLIIEAATHWPPLCRWQSQMHFLRWSCLIFI